MDSKLMLRDFGAAIGSSFCVAPAICIIDRSIIQNASGAMKLPDALRQGVKELMTKPQQFVRRPDFLMIWGLYFATYETANTIDTWCTVSKTDSTGPKFVGTTAVNMTACIAKDRAFTRMFGTKAPTGLPYGTYGLFALRDSATIAASFTMPAKISARMQDMGHEKTFSDTVAQFVCPLAVQLISTPMHLYGLDLYNSPNASSSQRWGMVRQNYVQSALARMARILPAFSIGGNLNRELRNRVFRVELDTGKHLAHH